MTSRSKKRHQVDNNGFNNMRAGSNNNNGQTENELTSNMEPNTFESPLELFGEAKKVIEGVFLKLDKSLNEVTHFYTKLDPEVEKNVDTSRAQHLQQSIKTIQSVLSRNQMKVAFFGRTSNGKSTVINAILHDRVLPMGYGHTTGCFLQIQGSRAGSEAYLQVQKKGQPEEQQTKQPIQSVSSIANALNTSALECSTLVKIYWPINKCSLLKYDVVLVDSPGVDVEENLDQWIDEHCHDADVFVLVSNAESTLNIAEKNFFHKVSQKLSKPNIFILNNRWDSIADDLESMEQVRKQHTERCISFLCDELKITTHDDARQRTFFVSARETLLNRTSQPNTESGNQNSSFIKEGYHERATEFESFERRFEESLSKSAVKTKFKKHTDRGIETIHELDKLLKSTQALVNSVCHKRQLELEHNESRDEKISLSVEKNLYNMEERIQKAKTVIEIAFDKEFDTEVRRLSRIVEDYEEDFSTDPEKLQLYKRALYSHVQKSLGSTFNTKVNNIVSKIVGEFNKEMCRIGQLLSEERQRRIEAYTQEGKDHMLTDMIDLDHYKQFYTMFQEDLEFRFSLGLVSIIRKFQTRFSDKPSQLTTSMNGDSFLEQSTTVPVVAHTDLLSILERLLMNPPQSPTTVGTLAVGGILVRTVGWKVIVITTIVYGTLYAYEYFTWTNSAKEASFKSQYVRYAKKGLKNCVPILSQQISRSIEKELTTTYQKVRKEIDEESGELKQNMASLKGSLERLVRSREFSSLLLKANEVLLEELINFSQAYL